MGSIQENAPVMTVDTEAIEAKNQEERNKRLNSKGINQFREAVGDLARFAVDPWSIGDGSREPIEEGVDALIVGCGFGGLLAARRLHEVGIYNIKMVDKASDFGGVWYWNRYPGLYCDTDAYIYLPLLEETGHVPSSKYVPGQEIRAHALNIATKENLREKALFQTELISITWSSELSRWICETSRGDVIRARFVISAIGILHKLHLPGIPGIENFKGYSFHSSRWDYDYTGGDSFGAPLSKLRSKRVGLVGTGASTIQVLPHLAASGAEVYVFQRTPSAVDERTNPKTDRSWFSSLKPGWQYERAVNFENIYFGQNPHVDLVDDGWTKHVFAVLQSIPGDGSYSERLKEADTLKMESIRSRIQNIIGDPETAEALKPWYVRTCKRPCFHNDYLPSFNNPNVRLVHTDGKGVERVTEEGVVAQEKEYKLDCIIYATGFDWSNDYSERANMKITGRNGQTMSEKWKRGPSTLFGIIGRDFPNLLLFTHLQSSTSPNYTHLLSERAKLAAYIVSECMKRKIDSVEPTQEAEDGWVKKLEDVALQYLDFFTSCTPGYYNQEGQLSKTTLRNASVGLTGPEWYQLAAEWRAAGKLEGLELNR